MMHTETHQDIHTDTHTHTHAQMHKHTHTHSQRLRAKELRVNGPRGPWAVGRVDEGQVADRIEGRRAGGEMPRGIGQGLRA